MGAVCVCVHVSTCPVCFSPGKAQAVSRPFICSPSQWASGKVLIWVKVLTAERSLGEAHSHMNHFSRVPSSLHLQLMEHQRLSCFPLTLKGKCPDNTLGNGLVLHISFHIPITESFWGCCQHVLSNYDCTKTEAYSFSCPLRSGKYVNAK